MRLCGSTSSGVQGRQELAGATRLLVRVKRQFVYLMNAGAAEATLLLNCRLEWHVQSFNSSDVVSMLRRLCLSRSLPFGCVTQNWCLHGVASTMMQHHHSWRRCKTQKTHDCESCLCVDTGKAVTFRQEPSKNKGIRTAAHSRQHVLWLPIKIANRNNVSRHLKLTKA